MNHLVELIYQAALERSRWREVLTTLAAQFHGPAVLFIQDMNSNDAGFVEAEGIDQQFLRSYAEHYAAINPGRELWVNAAAGNMLDSRTNFAPGSFEQTEFYNDFFRPQDIHFTVGTVLIKDGPVGTNIALQRSLRAGAFTEDELAQLRVLFPHLRRAIEISRQLTAAQWQREALALMPRSAWSGLIFADAEGRVLHADPAAESMLRADDGLGVREGRLCAATQSITDRLMILIRDATRTASGKGLRSGGARVLPRRRIVGQPLSILVCPWHGNAVAFGVPGPAALIFVEDPDRAPRPSAAGAAELYRLTAAEAKLLDALLNGQRLAEYAAAADIGLATAKTHLQSIFAKTGQRRQADLVRMILSSAIAQSPM